MLTAGGAIVPSCPQGNLYLILCLSIWQGIQRGGEGEGEGIDNVLQYFTSDNGTTKAHGIVFV
jgi:hypothetical protein